MVKESDTARTMKWFQKTVGMTLLGLMMSGASLFSEPTPEEKVATVEDVTEAATQMTEAAEQLNEAAAQLAEAAEVVEKAEAKEKSEANKEAETEKKSEKAEEAETKEKPEEAQDAKTDKEMEAAEADPEPKPEPEPEAEPLSEKEKEAAEEEIAKKKEMSSDEERQVFGWKEWVKIGTKADVMRAKLDSGARTSSLHAENVEEFERDGRKWVRFSMKDPDDEKSKSILIKAPIQRVAKVKNTDGSIERRFVVELGFEIGGRQLREEFTLNDRAGLICPVLIGRNALRHLGYVDCSRVDLATKKVLK